MNSCSEHSDKKHDSLPHNHVLSQCRSVALSMKKCGVHTISHMSAAGFQYTRDKDTARCKDCRLQISNWTLNMNPFTIHSQRRPDCPFVRSILTSSLSNPSKSTASTVKTSTSKKAENQSKYRMIGTGATKPISHTLTEADSLQQVRRRTFSHWSHRTMPSSAQMIQAGFFNCNIGDRVICIYCNLICQQWAPHADDPCDVHKTLSPNCPYVRSKLMRPANSPINVGDESSTQLNNNISRVPCNPTYSKIRERHASYATWPSVDFPRVCALVRAGFFYTGTRTIITCFYCNGSLQDCGPNDNPLIEHARWFPQCTYARQLCGEALYHQVQEPRLAQYESSSGNEASGTIDPSAILNNNLVTHTQQSLISDESIMSTLVADRLDLPISKRLLKQNFELSIIKRCWEDQLRLKHDDFVSESDLYMACLILQKQIEHINGITENIVIPSIKMKQIREQINVHMHEQTAPVPNPAQTTVTEMTTSSESSTNESVSSEPSVESISKSAASSTKIETKTTEQTAIIEDRNQSTPSNPCVLCLTEEKRLACIPCGHMAACVACGHSLRSCPICQQKIEAFIRIYV
ncbi:unnamed protein product [Rotaria magnacalcarata]|uniref:RING-type domain-containing protein n=3 Tax=Rotaria magnacalcarata TaxID=392030 RepID=A0A814YIW6_9BILA|nr:unnamed protein product [Rotaria magnacalcarata]CAF1971317.1 unnamed protein product [Rotaria magnacalcarata]CAF3983666.1 unnamed protein product [Rotaria magnacalcarata]